MLKATGLMTKAAEWFLDEYTGFASGLMTDRYMGSQNEKQRRGLR